MFYCLFVCFLVRQWPDYVPMGPRDVPQTKRSTIKRIHLRPTFLRSECYIYIYIYQAMYEIGCPRAVDVCMQPAFKCECVCVCVCVNRQDPRSNRINRVETSTKATTATRSKSIEHNHNECKLEATCQGKTRHLYCRLFGLFA